VGRSRRWKEKSPAEQGRVLLLLRGVGQSFSQLQITSRTLAEEAFHEEHQGRVYLNGKEPVLFSLLDLVTSGVESGFGHGTTSLSLGGGI